MPSGKKASPLKRSGWSRFLTDRGRGEAANALNGTRPYPSRDEGRGVAGEEKPLKI